MSLKKFEKHTKYSIERMGNKYGWYYPKDTEPFISCFRVLTYNTSFQYISNHAMSVIACYNYM